MALAVVSVGLASHLVYQPYRKALLQNLKTLADAAIFANLYLRWGPPGGVEGGRGGGVER